MSSAIGIMALTATATRSLRREVEELLGMTSPLAIIRSPDKVNIRFSVVEIKGYNDYEVPRLLEHVLHELQMKRVLLPRVIIFCKIKTDCAKLFQFFKLNMGSNFTEPPGASEKIVECRLVDMFF